MSYCKLKPNSPLYDSIESLTNNREDSLLLYTYFTSESFKNKMFSELKFSENGEPTFESVQPLINLEAVQSKMSKLKTLTNQLNDSPNILITDLIEKVVEFNKTHPDYIAVIQTLKTGESNIEVQAIEAGSEARKEHLEKAFNTYKIIDANLQKLGIPVTILNSEIMKFEDGLFNPQALDNSVTGLYGVINIANTMKGFEALPEEYAHLVIEALKDTPIIRRLENLITEDIAREVLGNDFESVMAYYTAKNKTDLVSREVLGRIYSQILSDTLTTTELPKSLLSRGWAQIINFINKFFSKGSIPSISEQINSIKEELQSYSKTKAPDTAITPDELQQLKSFGEAFAHTKANVDDVSKTFNQILSNLGQHINLFQDKDKTSDLITREAGLFHRLIQARDEHNKIEGMLIYVEESMNLMKMAEVGLTNIQKSLKRTDQPSFEKAKYHAHRLREIKSYLDSYKGPIKSVRELCNAIIKDRDVLPDDLQVSDEDLQALQLTAYQLDGLIFTLEDNYKILGKEVLFHFYKEFFNKDGADILLPNGTPIKLMQLFDEVEGDINLLDRWVQCTAESPDMLSQLVDRAIQDKQQEIRQKTQSVVNRIIELDQKFKIDGGNSTDFMYERDSDNNPVGYLLSPYNYAKYNYEKKQYTLTDKQFLEASAEEQGELLRIWDDNHGQRIEDVREYPVGGTVLKSKRTYTVPSDDYKSNAVEKLTSVQKAYYDEYMKLKNELDWLLPPSKTSPYMAVQKMVENAQEIILGHNVDFNQKLRNLGMNFLNDFRITENDEAIYGNKEKGEGLFKRVLTNFDKTIHNQIPIYYTNLLKDTKMLSTDASSAIMDYAIMAHNYAGMHQIVDLMEITKDIAKVRTVKRKEQGKLAKSIVKYAGEILESDALDEASRTKTLERLNETIETQVYGIQRLTSSNELLKFNLDKAMDVLMKYTAFSMLGYNMFTGINNIIVGKMQMFIESQGAEFFTFKEWAAGDLYYTQHIPEMMAELHTIKNTTKIGLIGEHFNVGLGWKNKLKDKKFYANDVTNAINNLHASFLLNAGEHHMQMSTAIAMLKHIKVKDASGRETSLFDALEVTTNDYKGKTLTANLTIRKGMVNLDGSAITDKQLRDISLQIGKVNQELHGIYNSEDAMGAKRVLAGRIFTMFRNFLVPTMNKRFKGIGGRYSYSFYHNMFREGTYTSAYKVGRQVFQHLRKPGEVAKIDFSEDFLKTLPEYQQKYLRHQKANLKRFATEIGAFLILTIALKALFDDDETNDQTWWNRSMYYFLSRLQLEMSFYPMPIGAGETILVSPTPLITPIKNTYKVLKSLVNGYDILENGPYKGHTELHRDFMKWLPIYNNVYDFYHINEDDKRFKIFETQ